MPVNPDVMLLSKFSKREKILLVATILIVSTTVSYVFIIEPIIGAFTKLNRQIETGTLKLERSQKLLKKKGVIEAEYKKYASLVKPLASDEEEIASMLKAIEAIARKNNIHITNIRPQPVAKKPFYKEFIFEFVAEADIARLIKFIYDLQVSGNLLRVNKLTLSATSKKQKGLKAIMEITKPSMKSLSL